MPELNVARVQGLPREYKGHDNDTTTRRGVQLKLESKRMKEAVEVALPNQPMERTPPRCARLRRSSAR